MLLLVDEDYPGRLQRLSGDIGALYRPFNLIRRPLKVRRQTGRYGKIYRWLGEVKKTVAGPRLTHMTGMRCDGGDPCRRSVIGARQCSDLG